MENKPLVSVITPYFNAASTLPMALSSLISQSYPTWECILVDDGSNDNPLDVINRINDPRIKYFKLEINHGRAYARQYAFDHANGIFLCMLDADDWLYPDKIANQVIIMQQHPDIALISTNMSLVDQNGGIIGIEKYSGQCAAPIFYPSLKNISNLPVPHAPSMIRANIAKKYRFDESLPFGEDFDYLIQILMQHPYAILPEASYVYNYSRGKTRHYMIPRLRDGRRVFRKYRKSFPLTACLNILISYAKTIIYQLMFFINAEHILTKRRLIKPELPELELFKAAKQKVMNSLSRLGLQENQNVRT